MKVRLFLLSVAWIAVASAKTVALWTLDYDGVAPVNGGRCAVSALNDLTVSTIDAANVRSSVDVHGWNLPPNPDATTGLRFNPINLNAPAGTTAVKAMFKNTTFARRHLKPSDTYAIECWLSFNGLPSDTKFYYLFGMFGSADNNRVLFTLRNNNGGYTKTTDPDETSWISFQIWTCRPKLGEESLNGEYPIWKVKGDDLVSLTNGFHHIALMHTPNNNSADPDNGKTEWRLYFDGTLKGSVTASAWTDEITSEGTGEIEIYGRYCGNSFSGAIDYMRVSDKMLDPTEFLNYGDAGTVVGNTCVDSSTVAYWPLGVTSAGGIDGLSRVGEARLWGGRMTDSSADHSHKAYVSEEGAFSNNIPNTATTIKSSTANAGSAYLRNSSTAYSLGAAKLGEKLTFTNDFTVEGWYKYECPQGYRSSTWSYLFGIGADSGSPAWAVQTYYNANTNYLSFHAHTRWATACYLPDGGSPNCGAIPLDDWIHLALVYDADGGGLGRGIWKIYKDGALAGVSTNKASVSVEGLSYANYQLKLGSAFTKDSTMPGKYDHWRVCQAALEPEQFLCASGATARDATNVLAYWPLDVKNGVYFDGRDLTGNYTFETIRTAAYTAVPVASDTPPQPGLSASSGCVGFSSDGGGSASYLLTGDTEVTRVFGTPNWTVEGWMKRTGTSTNWSLLFYVINGLTLNTAPSSVFNLTYRPADDLGFVMYSTLVDPTERGDVTFLGEDGSHILVPMNTWTHIACSFEKTDDGKAKFILYTNGVYAAKCEKTFGVYQPVNCLAVGGRPKGNTFQGRMASVRVSSKTRVPGEFLCDTGFSAKKTAAFWPLEGADDVESRVDVRSGFYATNVSKASSKARARVPNPDTSEDFVGDPKRNAGAVTLASNGSLATGLDPFGISLENQAFTAEGWIKWRNEAGATLETVAGNFSLRTLTGFVNGTTPYGWRLVIDSTVTPAKFRLQADGGIPCNTIADGLFTGSPEKDVWTHVAITYDPCVHTGRWTLYLNGAAAGTVENRFLPILRMGGDVFRLGAGGGEKGSVSMAGDYDMWRLSCGVLSAEEILYRARVGTTVFLH